MTALVLAASGRLGPSIVDALLAAGETVIAAVRDEARAATVLPEKARLAVGDFADRTWMSEQLDTVDSLVLLTPHGPDMADAQFAILNEAALHDVRVVKVSGTGPLIGPDGPDACR